MWNFWIRKQSLRGITLASLRNMNRIWNMYAKTGASTSHPLTLEMFYFQNKLMNVVLVFMPLFTNVDTQAGCNEARSTQHRRFEISFQVYWALKFVCLIAPTWTGYVSWSLAVLAPSFLVCAVEDLSGMSELISILGSVVCFHVFYFALLQFFIPGLINLGSV